MILLKIFYLIYTTKFYLDYAGYDDYSIYKSSRRFSENSLDYDKFISIYLRADSSRTTISRNYQKISESIAEISAIFSNLFIFLCIIVRYINDFYSNNNIFRYIFKFKNIKDTESYDLNKNIKKKWI